MAYIHQAAYFLDATVFPGGGSVKFISYCLDVTIQELQAQNMYILGLNLNLAHTVSSVAIVVDERSLETRH